MMHPVCRAIFSLLLFGLLCGNGQAQMPEQPAPAATQPAGIAAAHPMLVKTQHSNEYQSITCFLEDSMGNRWFGTSAEGLYRYNGKSFVQFTTADGLTCNAVHSILQDRSGTIWIGTRDGLCRMDGSKIRSFPIIKRFSFLQNASNDYYTEQSTKQTVWSMLQDQRGVIWLGTGDGLYCYDGKQFSRFLDDPQVFNQQGLTLRMISSMVQDKTGAIWLASGMPPGQEGIIRFDGKKLESFKPNGARWFRKIIEDKNGNLFFATRINGVMACNVLDSSFSDASFKPFVQPKELLNNSLSAIMKDWRGDVWVASDYGINISDQRGGLWHGTPDLQTGAPIFEKLTGMDVFGMFEDNHHYLWICTRGTGLYRYDGSTLLKFSE